MFVSCRGTWMLEALHIWHFPIFDTFSHFFLTSSPSHIWHTPHIFSHLAIPHIFSHLRILSPVVTPAHLLMCSHTSIPIFFASTQTTSIWMKTPVCTPVPVLQFFPFVHVTAHKLNNKPHVQPWCTVKCFRATCRLVFLQSWMSLSLCRMQNEWRNTEELEVAEELEHLDSEYAQIGGLGGGVGGSVGSRESHFQPQQAQGAPHQASGRSPKKHAFWLWESLRPLPTDFS